ncbi:MAG: hypothetical protein ABSB82_04285 [Terriglobia bacterium]|jgi:hypothetical protein
MKRKFVFVVALGLLSMGNARLLRAQDAPAQEEANAANEYVVPEGTEFKLQLHTALSSKTSKAGDRVMTTLIDPVAVEDRDVLPKGIRIDGHIGEVKAAGRRGKGGYLTIVFDTLEMPNGEKVAILGSLTEVFSSEGSGDPNVGPEGDLKGRGASKKKQAAMILAPSAAGAAAGVGPGIAAAGVGVAAALILFHGQQAALPAGSLIGMRLDQDVTLTAAPPTAEK